MGIEQEVEAAGGKVCRECQVIYVQDECPKCRIEAPARAAEAAAAKALRIDALAREIFIRNVWVGGVERAHSSTCAENSLRAAAAYIDASDEMAAALIPTGEPS